MKGAEYFIDALAHVPAETRKRVEYSMTVSDKIASILEKRKMSQKEFAAMIGHSEAEICRWLSGRHNFTLSTIAKISVALGEDIISVTL